MTLRFAILAALSLVADGVWAQQESGDIYKEMSLDSVVVSGENTVTVLRTVTDGSLKWNMSTLDDLPKIFGNADPLHYAQMLPGVTTSGEYDAGLHILGCENGHNYVSVNGSPMYGVQHLFGLFSVFNASHFDRMSLSKSAACASSPSRLGAVIDMQTSLSRPDSLSGDFSVGIISSQGTLRVPVTQRSHLTASFRGSYLNLFYGALLDASDSRTRYSFYDANVDYCHKLDDSNTLLFDFCMSSDDVSIMQKDFSTQLDVQWDNELVALKWLCHKDDVSITNNLYYTRLGNKGVVTMNAIRFGMPSAISEFGNKFKIDYKGWTAGMEMSFYRIKPQLPVIESSFVNVPGDAPTIHSRENSLYLTKSLPLCAQVMLTAGLRGSVYAMERHHHVCLSPTLRTVYSAPCGFELSLDYSHRHQFLSQTGLTSINTPLEFWLCSDAYGLSPQSAHSLSLTGHYVTPNRQYDITVECYNRWLKGQTEYNGSYHSFFSNEFDLTRMMLHGSGHNYGGNMVVAKNSGFITGWVSYAYSRALRTYDSPYLHGTFPASHERLHEFNALVVVHPGKRWNFGFTAVLASGTPYTAPLNYHMLQEQLIPQFSEHNAMRLKPYFRLDASANYDFRPTRHIRQHGINLSVYNMTGHKNELFHYMKANAYFYQYKTLTFALRVMPSVSYYMKF